MGNSYAVSINIKHISTSPKARRALTLLDAVATAKARFRYQTRDAACDEDDVICHYHGETTTGEKCRVKSLAYLALSARAEKHTEKNGVRLCDTGHISLPNDASREEQREIARDLVRDMVGDSAAFVVAAIHHDKQGNRHLHWWAIDGLETKDAARARSPNAKRIRQRDHLRLNEGGSREVWRERMAGITNRVGARQGRRRAEHRSLQAQRISYRKAQIHEGVEVQDKFDKAFTLSRAASDRIAINRVIIAKNIQASGGTITQQLRSVPKRWRRLQFFDFWRSKLELLSRCKIQGKAKISAGNQTNASIRRFPNLPSFAAQREQHATVKEPTLRQPSRAHHQRIFHG